MKWAKIGKFSDGNGIIVDSVRRYRGRILVANNVAVNNGGSGIHSFKSDRVDIVNNTAYLNGATPELRWGQIFVQSSTDVRVVNNILWARDGQPVNTVGPGLSDKGNARVVRANNLYFGGGHPPIMGDRDRVADPLFVNPSTDPAVADFRLKPGSPALAAGRWDPFTPAADLDGTIRPRTGPPDLGAYQRSGRLTRTDDMP
jgi:parallel beta-helix repeat protein